MRYIAMNFLFITWAIFWFARISITVDFLTKQKGKKLIKLNKATKRIFFRTKYYSKKIDFISVCAATVQLVNYGILLAFLVLSILGCFILKDITLINIWKFGFIVYDVIVFLVGVSFGSMGVSRQVDSDEDINNKLY